MAKIFQTIPMCCICHGAYSSRPRFHVALNDWHFSQIKGAIDNWADGSPSPVKFKEEQYSTIYKSHLDSLNEFESVTAKYKLLDKLLWCVYKDRW